MVILPKSGESSPRGHLGIRWPDLSFRSMEILGQASGSPTLRLLVHKPTFACNAACVGCESRRQLHRASRRNTLLSFEQTLDLYRQADRLGVSELHLSGGEPTLYKRLPELVAEAKRLGWFVSLNTNGSRLGEGDLAERLFEAGLDGVMLSLYSHREEVHDGLRQTPGLWRRAVAGLDRIARLREQRNPRFVIITQSILSRDNLFDAPGLLDLVGGKGSDVHLFSYVEGDFEARLVPTVDMLDRFRRVTVPALRRAARSLPDALPLMKGIAWWRLGLLFDTGRNSDASYAACVYNETEADCRRCNIPNEFMLALPDGNIHPCNVVEYTHEPVMGNFRETGDLAGIWRGAAWERFRRERHHWCRRCPMTHHNWVPLNLTLGRAASLLRRRFFPPRTER